MLSVIIPTLNSERTLVSTLGALVSGATAGLISEVLLVDGGSHDESAAVADVAGCNFMRVEGTLAKRLAAGAAKARAPWLMFLRPGTIPDQNWTGEATHLIERGRFAGESSTEPQAAVFRRGARAQSSLREALSLLITACGARPRPEQGLLIAKPLYDALGGHSESAADPEADLIQRIGRRRLATLASSAFQARA